MTCKDCLHFEVCDSGRHIGDYIEDDGVYTDGVEKECPMFKAAVDVVPVVRCKDCKKWEQYENTSGAGYCHNKKYCFTYGTMLDREFTPITMPDDYCSYGERYGE